MKKLLLLFILSAGILHAQEPYRQLVITEVMAYSYAGNYTEITNMGNQSVNLKDFKYIGDYRINIPEDMYAEPWTYPAIKSFMLPDFILEPGQSFVITAAYDFGPRMYEKDPYGPYSVERPKRVDMYDLADVLMHYPEPGGDETDSITPGWEAFQLWEGANGVVLEHHFAEGDSAIVDNFNVIRGGVPGSGYYVGSDVAGVATATRLGPVMRKFAIKNGNLDFFNGKGSHLDDSEWIAIPYQTANTWRDSWWTIGNHGPYVLDENTLESDVINVDFAGKKLTVPWGVRRLDGIMRAMTRKPGIAWHYHLNENQEDSVYQSVKTGDKLEIMVCGNTLYTAIFDIVVSEPANNVNIVVPVAHKNLSLTGTGPIVSGTQNGILSWPRVTEHSHGTDTITGSGKGLAFELRTDSLLKYLEKPSNATWEFIWVDGVARPNLKNGDKLKVTAQNGDVKEYFIQVQPYLPSNNPFLSSITWPDMPEYLKGIYGWKGDTIPNFNKGVFDYRITIPLETEGIPALVAKTENLNSTVEVKRAVSFTGTKEGRTISFVVTAPDGISQRTYNVELVKEKDPVKIQPYFAEPFVSEIITGENNRNGFLEIYNPGNQPIDLSNYMFNRQSGVDIAARITSTMGEGDWNIRFRKYVPGYKYVSEQEWPNNPGILVPDLAVNPIIQPGEMFIMAVIPAQTSTADINAYASGVLWPPLVRVPEVQFMLRNHPGFEMLNNPWGEEVSTANYRLNNPPLGQPRQEPLLMFKILNDSVKRGLKPVNDPYDYELIEAIGMADGSAWRPVDPELPMAQWSTMIRKPQIYMPNPVIQGSFGATPEESEWMYLNTQYWTDCQCSPYPGMQARRNCINDYGKHVIIEPTHYKSTVSSIIYKVSDGYSMEEDIRGIKTGTTVADFLNHIIKDDENQTLTVKSKADDSQLSGDALLTDGDLLHVVSSDKTNTSQYIIEVSDQGLSSLALLSSQLYTVAIESEPGITEAGTGSITGFEYGTRLTTILNNITIPAGASLNAINSSGAYVPLKMLNFDTAYVDVTVNSDIYLDVLAEDGITRIVYQLLPSSSENDAFVLSDVYTVVQSTNLVHYVPRGTYVQTLLTYLIPSTGATMKVVDKMGHERTEGSLYEDDKVVVTSANGMVTRVYHLSMLRTQYILGSDYLAYVLSNVYNVDQVNYVITGPSLTTSVADFHSAVTPVAGATVGILDSNGNEKTTGGLAIGDKLQVISKDGKIVVEYAIDILNSVVIPEAGKIQVYPNPTSGSVNIQGLEQGTRIQIYTPTGVMIRDIKTQKNLETLSLNNQPSGMYLIVLTKDSRLLGQYKVIRR